MEIKTTNIVSNIVQLNVEDETNDLPKEVIAAMTRNPTLKWIKFILTDDAPNANKQRIPKDEFTNIIKSGIYMPIKMAQGYIRNGHEYSVPIGSITGLVDRGHFIEGIAGLWGREFPGEVQLLEEMAATDEKPQLSWELLYMDSTMDEDGIESFSGISLAAATVVGMPAYEGRTPITLVASKNAESDYKIKTEEHVKMDEKIKELTDALELMKTDKEKIEGEYAELKTEHESLKSQFDELKASNDELTAFKQGIEAAKEREEKLEAIKSLFAESGVELPADYLEDEEKRDTLLAMDINQLSFLLQELSVFASNEDDDEEENEEEASLHIGSDDVPNIKGPKVKELGPKEIAEALRKEREKSA